MPPPVDKSTCSWKWSTTTRSCAAEVSSWFESNFWTTFWNDFFSPYDSFQPEKCILIFFLLSQFHSLKTQSQYRVSLLSPGVSKILTACRFKKTLMLGYVQKAEMHSFPNMPIMGGLIWSKWVKKTILSKKVPKKQHFWGTQIWIPWLWRGVAPTILKIFPFLRCALENLGYKLSDEP